MRIFTMTIYIVCCIRKENGKIIGVGTVYKGGSGQDNYKYFPLSEVFRVQDTDEFQIDVTNTAKNVNIGLRVTKDMDDYIITEPGATDSTSIDNIPECNEKLEFKKFFET